VHVSWKMARTGRNEGKRGEKLNNFIHHKSGSNEYKDKQTNITKLTLTQNCEKNEETPLSGVWGHMNMYA